MISVNGKNYRVSDIIETLSHHLTDERVEKVQTTSARRTKSIVTVMDGIYDKGNISAVMRSVEALGFLDVHVCETQDSFKASNRITQGTDKWLNVTKWDESKPCAESLKKQGFQIVSTDLNAAVPLAEVDFSIPTAIVFGNERDGVSKEFLEASDKNVIIPMNGFAQSFNISVAAAITLYHISLVRKNHATGDLSPEEQEYLFADYLVRCFEKPGQILEHSLNSPNQS